MPRRLPTRDEEARLPPSERGLGDEGLALDLPHVHGCPPTTPVPEALRVVLEELAAMRDAGTLTREGFIEAYRRALDALEALDDDDERLAHMEPIWAFGAVVGCLRE